VINLDGHSTQAEFGEIVGISQPAVSGLLQRGVLTDGATTREWLLDYCDHLRETAAGRASDTDGVNLVTERALLAREQREKIAMQNAVTRKELAPAYALEEIIARAGAKAASILDTIPGELKRRVPQLTADDIRVVALTIAKARNIAAAMSLADLDIAEGDVDEPVGDAPIEVAA
jgi:phage terminase Nu1 subunit (DNA packaging protein)